MAIPIPGIFIQGSTFFREALVLTLRATLCELRLSAEQQWRERERGGGLKSLSRL